MSKNKSSRSLKYLGVYIDQNLKWKYHLLQRTQKLRYLIFVFYKMRMILNTKQLITIYYGLFWSVATYAIIAWEKVYENTLQPLLNVQKTIIKMIFRKSKTYPSKKLYRDKNIIDIKKILLRKILFVQLHKLTK